MKSIFGEYTLVVMAVIAVTGFLITWGYLVNDSEHGVVFTYNTNMMYDNELVNGTADTNLGSQWYDTLDNVTNIVPTLTKPTLGADENGDGFLDRSSDISLNGYVIELPADVDTLINHKSYYSYAETLDLFSANDMIRLWLPDGTNKSLSDVVDEDGNYLVDIIITKYVPMTTGVSSTPVYEEVPARDKYGNILYDNDGNELLTKQIKYLDEPFSRSGNPDIGSKSIEAGEFFIDWDVAGRYKVILRYSEGTLKTEYTLAFANKVRDIESLYEEVYEEWVNPGDPGYDDLPDVDP